MKLTTKGRYAVQALADIAVHGGASPVAAGEVALRQGISAGYLEQLLGKLRRADMVESVRGVAGGYRLARPARDIRIADIVAAADEKIKTTACEGKSGGCLGASARCLTHDLWDELGRQIAIFLNAVTLEDVIERRVLGMASVNAPVKPVRQQQKGLLGAAE
ncbi:MAG: Rrf2 family transcriptional regulator [Parvularculaceae bacterium]